MKLYIAVLDEFPDYMVPTLVAHSMLGAHLKFQGNAAYIDWLRLSFKKCVIRVNAKEFDKILSLDEVFVGHENKTLDGRASCAIPLPCANEDLPNVLKFAKLWSPRKPDTRELPVASVRHEHGMRDARLGKPPLEDDVEYMRGYDYGNHLLTKAGLS